MWPRVRDQRLFIGLLGGLVVLAWLSLWIWSESPYGRFLSHEENESLSGLGDRYLVLIALFVAGWTLMTVAMMLPTSLPLVAIFQALVRKKPNHVLLVVLLVTGYLIVWVAFAVAVHLGDLGLHEAVERSRWFDENAWVIGAATLILAGLYQFAPLKRRCLDKCRSPLSFVMEHWRGGREHAHAFRLGVHHGLFCLGCCWSLMLLMFAVGIGNLAWMLVLAVVMAVEKNMPWGRHLSAPVGVVLLAAGILLVATGGGVGAIG